jgi:hypothetical protein
MLLKLSGIQLDWSLGPDSTLDGAGLRWVTRPSSFGPADEPIAQNRFIA